MLVSQILFYTFSVLIVFFAFFLAISKNIIHSAFAFLAILLGVAVLFIFSGAEFAAVTQLLVYIGGVLVLLIFGVMLTAAYTISPRKNSSVIPGLLVSVSIFALFIFVIAKVDFNKISTYEKSNASILQTYNSDPQKIGYLLMTDYLLPFEASGILLMVALIGAAMIAGKKNSKTT